MQTAFELQEHNIDPDVLERRCGQLGYKIAPSTIRSYTYKGMIQEPKRGSVPFEANAGTYSYYHDGAHIEAVTAYVLQKHLYPLTLWSEDDRRDAFPKLSAEDILLARYDFINWKDSLPADSFSLKLLQPFVRNMYNINSEEFFMREPSNHYDIEFEDKKIIEQMSDDIKNGIYELLPESTDTLKNYFRPPQVDKRRSNAVLYRSVFIRLAIREYFRITQTKLKEDDNRNNQ